MKIFITGCAKSGTTLLLKLFYAFDITVYDETDEVSLFKFSRIPTPGNGIVAKRSAHSILSYNFKKTRDNSPYQADLIRKNKIMILNIVRDGRDVVLSDNFYVSPERWLGSIKQRKKYKDIIKGEVRYEDIINDPQKVQIYLELTFGLKRKHNFIDFPKFVPKDKMIFSKENPERYKEYDARPLTSKSINKDPDKYLELCKHDDNLLYEFEFYVKSLGYVI